MLKKVLEETNNGSKPSNPLELVKLTNRVIIHRLNILEKSLIADPTLENIEQSLVLFSYIIIKEHQEDVIIHPLLQVSLNIVIIEL